VRAPDSEPASTLHALDVLVELDARDDPMIAGAAAWIATIADPDGGVPFVMPTAAAYPHAPWMVPSQGGSFLTFAISARLWEAGTDVEWRGRATDWCWKKLEGGDELAAYSLKFALDFLDTVPDHERAEGAIERVRPRLGADGSIAVPGGTENERLTPLTLSERPHGRSRLLFSDDQIEADLDLLESRQQADGGWIFDWLGWSEGQSVEWRGLVTLRALTALRAHGRIGPAGAPTHR
jgi:hypothetical protein